MLSTFKKYAFFKADTFLGTADFSNGTFRGIASFLDVHYRGDVTFSGANFEENVAFFRTRFDGKVNLTSTQFRNISILWKQIEDRLICDTPTSYKLLKYFEEKRQLDDADGVYLFLKDQERMKKFWLWRYLEYLSIQLTCGYGTKPQNTIYLSIGIILVLMLFYTKSNAIREIEKEFGHRRRRRKSRIVHKRIRQKLYDAFCFSVQTFIIGVVPDWCSTQEFLIKFWKIKRIKFRTLAMIEGALGWILLVLFVVTLTRKFIR
jgi:hypothetical protein